jgi:HEAT repeat protein
MLRLSLNCLTLQFVLVTGAVAQCAVPVAEMGRNSEAVLSQRGGLTPTTTLLEELHVPLTTDYLLLALQSEDHVTRSLAAGELAAKGVKEAIPEIQRLLDNETEPWSRNQLALDLANLGDDEGVQMLESLCTGASKTLFIRLEAADRLHSELKQKSCPVLIVAGVNDPEFSIRIVALDMIPDFQDLPARQWSQLRALLWNALSDPESDVRREAAVKILELGEISAIPVVQAAIATEADANVKSEMIRSLKSLQDKQP